MTNPRRSADEQGTSRERERSSARQAADLAAMRRMLVASQGCFSLSFAVCNDRALRNEVVEHLRGEFPGILAVVLKPRTADVYQVVRDQLAENRPTAVFVFDLEASVSFEATTHPALRALNSSRELWEQFECPVVFWLAEYAATLMATEAPDFWRYHSHQFEFVSDPVPMTQAIAEPFPGYEMVDALPFEEKRFRMSELEQRLADAGTQPSADILPHALNWSYELAYLYRHANQFQRARTVLQRAMAWAEQTYGTEDLRTATALSNLAALLFESGRSDRAEELYRRALAIDEQALGPDHPTVARDLNNLATSMGVTTRSAETEPLLKRALQIAEKSLGPRHLQLARHQNNLAVLLKHTGRIADAEARYRTALRIDEEQLGPDHPIVARDLGNLAMLLQETNRSDEAEPLLRRAISIFSNRLGEQHPSTVLVENRYRDVLRKLGHSEDEIATALKTAKAD